MKIIEKYCPGCLDDHKVPIRQKRCSVCGKKFTLVSTGKYTCEPVDKKAFNKIGRGNA